MTQTAYQAGVLQALNDYLQQGTQKGAELQDPSTPAAHPSVPASQAFRTPQSEGLSSAQEAKELASSMAQARAGQKKLQHLALKGRL